MKPHFRFRKGKWVCYPWGKPTLDMVCIGYYGKDAISAWNEAANVGVLRRVYRRPSWRMRGEFLRNFTSRLMS